MNFFFDLKFLKKPNGVLLLKIGKYPNMILS